MTNEVTGKSGLGVQNEAGQRLTEFCQANIPFQQHETTIQVNITI